ncbi:hypothetical protein MUG78_13515 [Gordonia alkaliphila]|uniref:hypothetical protein n=1 Tax=Gordonia alkaliphila TaxID=1053547 RepID=UPI001FF6FADE|nr:hypothetical protein [Gordonia alkaliphila]MCK0440444.1 hypothetical protein [Gordonia alkaliphila]
MLAQIAVIPSAPLLVPELAGPDAVDTEPVRAAVRAAGERLAAAAARWIAVGVGAPAPGGFRTDGDFGAFGVPVPVRLAADGSGGGDAPLPLSMLLAAWLGERVTPPPQSIRPVAVDPAATAAACADLGARLLTEAAGAEPMGLLVVADGPTALSPTAPGGGERASAWALQRTLEAAVAAADGGALAALSAADCAAEGVGTRAAWQVLGGVLDGLPGAAAEVDYAAAPFGVGYLVATVTTTEESSDR